MILYNDTLRTPEIKEKLNDVPYFKTNVVIILHFKCMY